MCGWIDVPLSQGKSRRSSGSLHRDSEAQVIAKEAKRILENNPELSVGVITFYRAQVNSILHAMKSEGLTEGKSSSIPNIKPEWQSRSNQEGGEFRATSCRVSGCFSR